MPEGILDKLLDLSLFSPFLLVLGWYVWVLHREKNAAVQKSQEIQAAQVKDAKEVAAQLIALNEKWQNTFQETLTAINATLEAHKRAWGEVKSLLRNLREHVQEERESDKGKE